MEKGYEPVDLMKGVHPKSFVYSPKAQDDAQIHGEQWADARDAREKLIRMYAHYILGFIFGALLTYLLMST